MMGRNKNETEDQDEGKIKLAYHLILSILGIIISFLQIPGRQQTKKEVTLI